MRISKKLSLALVSIAATLLAERSPHQSDAIFSIAAIASSYLLGQSHVDAKKLAIAAGEGALSAVVSSLAPLNTVPTSPVQPLNTTPPPGGVLPG